MENPESNYNHYKNASEEALKILVKAMKEDVSEKEQKLAITVLNSARVLMKEHNSHMHQTRSNKMFQLDIFKQFATQEQKEEFWDKLKVGIDNDRLIKLLNE